MTALNLTVFVLSGMNRNPWNPQTILSVHPSLYNCLLIKQHGDVPILFATPSATPDTQWACNKWQEGAEGGTFQITSQVFNEKDYMSMHAHVGSTSWF
jgi:hypothetical protein